MCSINGEKNIVRKLYFHDAIAHVRELSIVCERTSICIEREREIYMRECSGDEKKRNKSVGKSSKIQSLSIRRVFFYSLPFIYEFQ